MDNLERTAWIEASWQLHAQIESRYLADSAVTGTQQWLEKRRLLLADLAIHLCQTALNPGDLDTSRLAQNIYSVLVVADDFMPETGLKNFSQAFFQRRSALR